jgi:hypothetical protein
VSDAADTERFELSMWAEVGRLERLKRDRDEAEERFQAQRAAVAVAMKNFGAAANIAEQAIPVSIIRSLYWEHRDIAAQDIAEAFGIHGGAQVHRYAGTFADFPCPAGCGRTVRLTARTAQLRPCEECADRVEREREAWWEETRKRQRAEAAERDAWIESQLRAGQTVGDVYTSLVAPLETGGPLPIIEKIAAELETD